MKVVLAILAVAFVIAIIYAGALKGPADAKVRRLFIGLVVALALAAAAVLMRPGTTDDDDTTRPRLCNGAQC